MIVYYKLFDRLNRQGKKKTDLLQIMGSPALAKFGKNEPVRMDIIDRLCEYLDCQPGDLIEYIPNCADCYNPSGRENPRL